MGMLDSQQCTLNLCLIIHGRVIRICTYKMVFNNLSGTLAYIVNITQLTTYSSRLPILQLGFLKFWYKLTRRCRDGGSPKITSTVLNYLISFLLKLWRFYLKKIIHIFCWFDLVAVQIFEILKLYFYEHLINDLTCCPSGFSLNF